jgi:hypothetical protein
MTGWIVIVNRTAKDVSKGYDADGATAAGSRARRSRGRRLRATFPEHPAAVSSGRTVAVGKAGGHPAIIQQDEPELAGTPVDECGVRVRRDLLS